MNFFYNKGIFFGSDLVIDPETKKRAENVVITHAHADHVCLDKESKFFFSKPTHSIIESRYSKVQNPNPQEFKKRFSMPLAKVSLHNSGHILGSSQVLIEGDNTIAITSDFKLQDSLVQKGAEILKSDVLLIETTFGLPAFEFPSREQVYSEMSKWIREKTKNSFVLLAGYSLGKAQELTAISNEYAGITPIVHDSIFKMNKVYEKEGVKLGEYYKLDHNLRDSNVLIMPPSLVKPELISVLEETLGKKIFSAMATGWQYRNCYSKIFPLSDHADFNQLMHYVKEAKPKAVFTFHGYAREFANTVQRRLRIPSRALEEAPQKFLQEYC
ncbi:MAG: hypothetical protein JW772_02400 [Candidatus Diapherotrites archaeon]|nr:hypothetical protein [Candidatus Diapherotrites archaeon]